MLHEIIGGLLSNAGVRNEIEYWSKYSSGVATSASAVDHMSNALGTIGFYGHPRDAFNKWAGSLGSNGVVDNLIGYFSNTTLAALPLGLTFYKDFTNTSTPDADFSIGSKTATFTWSTTDSTRTYIDSDGIIQIADTVNTPRYAGGYYDSTGFHTEDTNGNSVAGLMIEGAGTNYSANSYCSIDSNSDGMSDYWALTENSSSPITQERTVATDISGIESAYWQHVGVTGATGENTKYFILSSGGSADGTFSSGDKITFSVYVKGSTTGCTLFLQIQERDLNGYPIRDTGSYALSPVVLSSTIKKYSYTITGADRTRTISAFADAGGGEVLVTASSDTFLSTGVTITISGTTNYNGTYVMTRVDNTSFKITAAWAGDDATGTATAVLMRAQGRIKVTSLDDGNIIDLYATHAQLEKSPYATSYIPTTTAAVTRNAEVLKYAISGNRTAASETFFMNWIPIRTPIQSGSAVLLDSDTKLRRSNESSGGARNVFFPNATNSASCVVAGNNALPINTSVVYTFACDNSASKSIHARFFVNGSPSDNTPTDTDNFTSPVWGTYFYLCSTNTGNNQHDAILRSITIFNRELSSTEITNVYNMVK